MARRKSPPPNKRLLDELNRKGKWFAAQKKRPIWAKQADRPGIVSTLEGPQQYRRGDFLCRGDQGEVWPQSAAAVQAKYEPTTIIDNDGWRLMMPRRGAPAVMATRVDHAFTVQTPRGPLQGKRGDYVLKSYDDRQVEYPGSVWVVNARLFRATYRRVDDDRAG